MKFLFPGFLYALFTLAIPIIIHLFNFRKYKIFYFSNLRFLQEIKEQTQSQSNLKHLLILLSRLLALTALILAFAQPFIPVSENKGENLPRKVSVFLDNSFSMEGVGEDGALYEVGRQYAYELTKAYASSHQFQFINNNFEGNQQRLYSVDGYNLLVENAEMSPNFKSLKEVLGRQMNLLNKNETSNKDVYLISDFQSSLFNEPIASLDSLTKIFLIQQQPQTQINVSVDSIWFENPVRKIQQPELLFIKLKNYGSTEVAGLSIKLLINEAIKNNLSVDLQPFEEKTIELEYTLNEAGFISGKVEIEDFPVTFDNHFYFSYAIATNCKILAIHEKDSSKALSHVFKTDNYFELNQQNKMLVNYSSIPNYNLLILNELSSLPSGLYSAVNQFIEKGGNVLIIPSSDKNLEGQNEFLEALQLGKFSGWQNLKNKVKKVNLEHPIFQGVFEKYPENIDLPTVSKYITFQPNTNALPKSLLSLETGDQFLTQLSKNKSAVYLFSTPLSDTLTNFTKHALFVPTMLQIALYSGKNLPLFYFIGAQSEINLQQVSENITSEVLAIENEAKTNRFIPEIKRTAAGIKINFYDQINSAGLFWLKDETKIIAPLTFNYNRKESDLKTMDINTVKTIFEKAGAQVEILEGSPEKITSAIKQSMVGIQLWQWFLALAILFLVIEIMLIRFLK